MSAARPWWWTLRGPVTVALTLSVVAFGTPAVAATVPHSSAALPSGRTSYRAFADYEADLSRLAAAHPTKARRFMLDRSSLEGRPVIALEISRDVAIGEHKPVLLVTGAHHAREWPSAETTMEFAFDLLRNDGADPRVTALLDRIRVVVVPMVNPDGFKISRESTFAMKRRNCRVRDGQVPAPGECARSANFSYGVDLNRNYGAGWSGGGSVTSDTYPGAAPFSEPETQNIRDLVSSRQVTVLLSNHTYGAVVLRPTNPEDGGYRALADRLAGENGYGSSALNVGGMTERWSYYATAGFGFTVEIGTGGFHPPFQTGVIDQYVGTGGRRGLRSMYLTAGEAAADRTKHAVLTGRAAAGATLRIAKDFTLTTASGQQVPTHLESSLTVGSSGAFTWDINPSTRAVGSTVRDERWTLTCALPGGPVAQTVQVLVRRGQQAQVDLPACMSGPGPGVVYSDDFETARGWTVNPLGTDTATAGRWERADPQPTSYAGTMLQRGDTTSGQHDLVTGALSGADSAVNDLDGGVSTIWSPQIALPAGKSLTLSLRCYLAHLDNASAADYVAVKIVTAAGRATPHQISGAPVVRAGAWQTVTVDLSAYAGSSIRLLIEAADGATPSLVEAGVDDIRITAAGTYVGQRRGVPGV